MYGDCKSVSPNGKHLVTLINIGEIRFGPLYYQLKLNDFSFGDRIFGQTALWSPDSTIVCLQEWHTIDYQEGPSTSLLLVRPKDLSFFRFPEGCKGFASPDNFIKSTLVLRHSDLIFDGVRAKVERETDLSTIVDWAPLKH